MYESKDAGTVAPAVLLGDHVTIKEETTTYTIPNGHSVTTDGAFVRIHNTTIRADTSGSVDFTLKDNNNDRDQPQIHLDKCTVFRSSQLFDRYAKNSEGLKALRDLLDSWNLGDYFSFFKEQELYVGVLEHLCPSMAETLFQNTAIPLGARVEFHYQWSKWIKRKTHSNSNREKLNNLSNSNGVNHPEQPVDQSTTRCQLSSSLLNVTTNAGIRQLGIVKIMDLNYILHSNTYGKCLMQETSNTGNRLTDDLRKILCKSVLQFCIEYEHDLSVADCAALTEQILHRYPGELAEYYYRPRKKGAPLGKLYYKYRNWKNTLKRKRQDEQPNSIQKGSKQEVSDDDSGDVNMRAPKQESLDISYEEEMLLTEQR
ncbi:uncharacterized protein LOC131677034 [Topomyia yanbarensis]|uniref:uncharacterized protein LOC131677034 n=1 Tax=Topomyia yanbarensis TaxID=2498891 RepID=UPI00273BE3BD|nr:uncharacterized protein LOC131677034 [Topomyia yanbarensis]XP_058812529.1 uncharacterized protein LOC131677034 [Topomyia yanbarensis]XP_058812530.1 uncharacterized protein LOC131677034 [Topomyia yanbarensis]XP_058812531.1 uncharacterized protein LOC131677034 [Topomyia yanbarensis]XP_058812532.1 uncharacterized protein LOC131677034 [Topomyia yanbarensis]